MATTETMTDDDILASGISGKRSYVIPDTGVSKPVKDVVSKDPLLESMDAKPVYEVGQPKVESLIVQDKIDRDSSDEDEGFWNQFYGSLESTIFQDNPRLSGRAIEGLGRASGIDSMRELGESIVAEYDATPVDEKFVPRVSNYKDVDGLNSALDYLGSTIGQGAGSMAMTIGGGLAGAGAGAAVGSAVPGAGTAAGAVLGARAGSVGGSFLLNYGDTYEYMMEQEGMDPDLAAEYALVPGTIMAGLDAWGVGKLLGPAKGKLSSNIIKRTGQLAARGARTEGITEAAQQVIQETSGEIAEALGYATEDITFAQRLDNVLNNLVAGTLTGTAMGGATSPFKKGTEAPPPPPPDVPEFEDLTGEELDQWEQDSRAAEAEAGFSPEDLMMEREQDYYEGIADLRGDPLDLDRPEPPAPEDLQLELEELARFEGLKTIPEAMERKAEIESDFGSIEAYEAQRERERLVEIDQPDQTLQPQKYELHSFDPDYTPPSMSKDNPKPLSRREYNSLREQLDINKNDPRFNYGGEIRNGYPEGHRYAEKRINQPNLMENPDFDQSATKVYSETGLKGLRALIGRIESGPRGHVNFWVSDDIDLAIGQGGRGYMLEIDPRLVNGFQADTKAPMMVMQATGLLKGSEYQITQSVRGAVTALIFRNPRQIQALTRGAGQPGRAFKLPTYLTNVFDFENPIEFEFMRQGTSTPVKGLRVPRKTQRLSPVETDPDVDSDPDPKPPVILQQSPANVVQNLTDEAQAEGIEKLRSLILDLPEDSKQAYEEFITRQKEIFSPYSIGFSSISLPGFGFTTIWLPKGESASRFPDTYTNEGKAQKTLENAASGYASPEQYRLSKYLIDNPEALDKYYEANPDKKSFGVDLAGATNDLVELVILAQKVAQKHSITGVTIDDIYSGRFAEMVRDVAPTDSNRLTLEWAAKRLRKDFKEAQKKLDEAGIDYKIRIEPPTRVMLVRQLVRDYAYELYEASEDGAPMPPMPNLDMLIRDKESLPQKGSAYETFGAGSESEFSRSKIEGDLSTTLDALFEGVQEESKQPAMGVSKPEDVAEFVKSPAGAEPKWYEKAAERQRGAANVLRQTGETEMKLAKAWQTDSGIATIREFEYSIIKEFVNMVGPKRLENIAFAIEPKIRTGMMLNEPLGLYFFGKDIVGISHSAIASGRFVDTTIHELWHGLSQYLPDNTVNDLYTQYARERGEFMRANPEAFDRSGELVDVTMAKNQSTYRFSSFDEWVVEKMKDLSIEDASGRLLERDKTLGYSDTAPGKAWERALRALADLVRSHYNQLKAIFGRDVARQTYTEFMGGKYMEQVRSSPLAGVIKITPEDEARAAQRWTSYLDALDADEGVEAAAQSMSEETERFIEQMVVGPAEVVTDEEFKSLASQPPAPAPDTTDPIDLVDPNTKVVDESGKPLVVFHGTPKGRFDKAARELNQARRFAATERQRLTDEINDLNLKLNSLRENHKTLEKAEAEAREQAIKEWRSREGKGPFWTSDSVYKNAARASKEGLLERRKLFREIKSLENTRRELPVYRKKDAPEEERFDTRRSGWTDAGYRSVGSYFSESREEAEGYARNRATDPIVYEVYLNLLNPYEHGVTKTPEGMIEEINRRLDVEKRNAGKYWLDEQRGARAKVRRQVLKEYGFDGEIWMDRGLKEYIAFEPEQVIIKDAKSVMTEQQKKSSQVLASQPPTPAAAAPDVATAAAEPDDYRVSHQPSKGPSGDEIGTTDDFPKDILQHPEWYTSYRKEVNKFWPKIVAGSGNPDAKITIYRAMPKSAGSTIETGNWVTPSKTYAEDHAFGEEDWHVVAVEVPLRDINWAGDDLMEWGYWGSSTKPPTPAPAAATPTNVGTFKSNPDGTLIGYKIMRFDPETGEVVSGADSRIRSKIKAGDTHSMRGSGVFLSSDPQYVVDYYAGHEHNALITYSFEPSKVTSGSLTDKQPEISVSDAVVQNVEVFSENEIPTFASQPPAALSDTTRPKHPKLFNESGEPRVVYRGISEQKRDASTKKPSPNHMMFGEGVYFALKPDRSASYGNVGTYKLYIDNPMEFYSETTDVELSRWINAMNQYGVDSDQVISAIRAKEPVLTNGAIYVALGGSKFWNKDVSLEQLSQAKSIAIDAGFDSVLVSQGSSEKARLNDEVVVFDQSKIEKIGDLNDQEA